MKFATEKPGRPLSRKQKVRLVGAWLNGSESVNDCCLRKGLAPSTFRNWIAGYRQEASGASRDISGLVLCRLPD